MSRKLLNEMLEKVLKIPRRVELLGGQNYSYIRLEEIKDLIEAELEKPEPEPVCFVNESDLKKVTEKIGSGSFIAQPTHLTNTNVNGKIPLYAKPPAQQKPFSNDQIWQIASDHFPPGQSLNARRFARDIEKYHGIG